MTNAATSLSFRFLFSSSDFHFSISWGCLSVSDFLISSSFLLFFSSFLVSSVVSGFISLFSVLLGFQFSLGVGWFCSFTYESASLLENFLLLGGWVVLGSQRVSAILRVGSFESFPSVLMCNLT